jgi:hypothetical protein
MKQIEQRAQTLALKMTKLSEKMGKPKKAAKTARKSRKDADPNEWDDIIFRDLLCYPLSMEFFIATKIEADIMESISLSQDKKVIGQKECRLLDQRLLSIREYLYLVDAVEEERLLPDQLLNIVRLSHQETLDITRERSEKSDKVEAKDEIHSNFKSPSSAIAAANAITILNGTCYDFRDQDLSNICIPGANLSKLWAF